ncbi:hypothetical protein [Paenibacillus glycanilyticus]|uniref:Uncharacterized protein n=1 Tax=Paenibacillus glycanilyticus TaxID=126569 RepID=A0ABQ6GLQ3_9BACL|nr:hypothetical protein [Paenibacillus glycanilyticus]GLX70517.1 hypothetical protein MU1_48630 [Paenibacillus glycanilyticus]
MRYFIKFNAVSAIFALLPFIMSELLGNSYRINRITGIEIAVLDKVNTAVCLAGIVLLIVAFVLMLRAKLLPLTKTNLLLSVAWIPYYWLYIQIFVALYPLNNPADDPNPVSGLIILAGLFLYTLTWIVVNVALFVLKELKEPAH